MPGKRRGKRGGGPTSSATSKPKPKPAPEPSGKAVLPPKESNVFKSILRSYERKEYKKGVKAADTILKKFPEHGETLAMKGLLCNCLNKRDEAYELVRRGLRNNLFSHVCWHVYGLLYRSDRNYAEAIKCYQNALRHDKKNQQILRDLSQLQIQMRDFKGFLATRKQMFRLKDTHVNNWINLAVAFHLAGQSTQASKVIESYLSTQPPETEPDFERSELLLYQNMVIEEGNGPQAALDHLEKNASSFLDHYYVLERRASFFEALDRNEEAKLVYEQLLELNQEHYDYHAGYLRASGLLPKGASIFSQLKLEEETVSKVFTHFQLFRDKYPRCAAAVFIPLLYLEGDPLRQQLHAYLQPGLRKGVPSLFSALKPLYRDPKKVLMIESIMLSYLDSLEKEGSFPEKTSLEPPVTTMWTLAFTSWHFSHVGKTKEALEYIEKALKHTPTAVDLYIHKARIYKHAGDLKQAAEVLDYARNLDLADRYLNTISTKYWLRANETEKADSTISLFTKHDGTDSQNHLYDMQCLWYERESGDAYARLENYGRALKRYTATEKHFLDFVEDQFDFHSYCIRKLTLRAYVSLLRLEDRIMGHQHMSHAAAKAIEVEFYCFVI